MKIIHIRLKQGNNSKTLVVHAKKGWFKYSLYSGWIGYTPECLRNLFNPDCKLPVCNASPKEVYKKIVEALPSAEIEDGVYWDFITEDFVEVSKEFKTIEVQNEKYKLTLEDTNEGYHGDYDENNPDDRKLLRYTLYEKVDGEWEQVRDGSSCTLLQVNEDYDVLKRAARDMLDYVDKHGTVMVVCDNISYLSYAEIVEGKVWLPKIS